MNKKSKIGSKIALSIMLVFALVFNLVSMTIAPVQVKATTNQEFVESFENGFAPGGWRNINHNNPNRDTLVDATYITTVASAANPLGTPVFYPNPSGSKTSSAFIQKKFLTAGTGIVSVSFYDTATNIAAGTLNQFNIYNSDNASFNNGYVPGANNLVGLGISAANTYQMRTGTGGTYINTAVTRTTGWHTFKFDVDSTGTTVYLDGTQVGTHSGVTSFDTIDMGDIWTNSAVQMYYDNLQVKMGSIPNASLSAINVDGTPISGFLPNIFNYNVQVPTATPIPTVTVTTTDPNATKTITQATAVPGKATILVTSEDGTVTKTYTVNFKLPQPVYEFFDDFKYTSHTDPKLAAHNWVLQDGDGMRPGDLAIQWKASNFRFGTGPADTAFPNETDIMTISATATGTPSTSSNAQIREAYEKFGDGIYSSRIYFTDTPITGPNAKDKIVETFFPINRNQYIGWQGYSEADFEYLPNDGWGASTNGPAMYFTSWGPYTLSSTGSQVNVQNQSTNKVQSYQGWHTYTIVVRNGFNYYYIDGQLMASHGQPAGGADSPMAPAYNLWFLKGGINSNTTPRTYEQYVSWLYYTNDLSAFVTTGAAGTTAPANISSTVEANVLTNVNTYKGQSKDFVDTVPNPIVTASTIKVNGTELSGFAPGATEYTVPTTGTTVPTVTETATDSLASVTVIPATSIPGTTTVMVQSTDLVLNTTYHINFTAAGSTEVAPPVASVGNGAFVQGFNVALSAPINSGAKIYYTTDGTTPTTSSTAYTGPISIAGTYKPTMNTIKAIAVLSGNTSSVATFKYATLPLTPQVVAAPVISPNGGTFAGSATVTITDTATSVAIKGSDIYYTTDGSDPTTSATRILYTAPFALSSTKTVKAVATFPGVTPSNGVVSASFTVTAPQVAAPTATPSAGTYAEAQSVTLSSTTPSATIYYTTNGSTPTTGSILYTGPINVSSSMTINAIATATNKTNSAVSQFAYVIMQPAATPTATPDPIAGAITTTTNVSLSTTTSNAIIYYTTDGSTPSTSSPMYTEPFTLPVGSVTVKAIAVASGMADSAVGTFTYTVNPQEMTPPVTTANMTPAVPDGLNGWYVHPITLNLSASDSISGVAKTEYSLDGGATWQSYTSPVTFSQDGEYAVSYRSIDNAGNIEMPEFVSFKLDAIAPTISVTGLVYGTYSDSVDISPIIALSDDLSGVDNSKTTVTLDTHAVQQGTTIPLYTLPLGLHEWIVTSVDLAGNTGSQTILFQTTTNSNSLKALVTRFANAGWIDNAGIANSLQSKLSKGNLEAFINELEAQSGKHITTEASTYLLRDAQAILLSSNHQ
ncbi:hypothetical protein GC098_02805 [Paenibacillus sp. LMG 31458]|uniref:GH16 domain-containing protein n=1 Tax=Paenibacillus phytorum TaxID=2654977 RepID=A0ABX1XPA5_9BACL|nr:chitobiase/beta-hexosaminidase C-terminal domain-containing protein [Paenibacillus phytorum]NOU70375.1 hypothetical protein [Paenibacillus phytorum]